EAAAEETSDAAAEEKAAPGWNARMKKDELLAVARELGLDVHSKMKKAEIIEALQNA
ncbi:MAG: 50S ribosomal protein L21, partial [Deltaproteobacteria bacterium]